MLLGAWLPGENGGMYWGTHWSKEKGSKLFWLSIHEHRLGSCCIPTCQAKTSDRSYPTSPQSKVCSDSPMKLQGNHKHRHRSGMKISRSLQMRRECHGRNAAWTDNFSWKQASRRCWLEWKTWGPFSPVFHVQTQFYSTYIDDRHAPTMLAILRGGSCREKWQLWSGRQKEFIPDFQGRQRSRMNKLRSLAEKINKVLIKSSQLKL